MHKLKKASWEAVQMTDADGNIRNVRTILFSHIADGPEAAWIACTSSGQSPLSLASFNQFGDGKRYPRRTAEYTLERIQRLRQRFSDDDCSPAFSKAAKNLGLNGVLEPYWKGWKFAEPCDFLTPDSLHQWHKCFQDHAFQWAKTLMTAKELDARLMRIQTRVGYREFPKGVTRFKQHTGKETRDLERVFLGIIAGHPAINNPRMSAFRAHVDFIYTAQYQSHDEDTLQELDDHVEIFWDKLPSLAVVRSGPKKGGKFNIPKYERMHHVSPLIRLTGSSSQFTSDTVERLHITKAKIPYNHTNKRDFIWQMCNYIQRIEQLEQFERYLNWSGLETTGVIRDLSMADRMEFLETSKDQDLTDIVNPPFEEQQAVSLSPSDKQLRPVPFDLKGCLQVKTEDSAFSLTASPAGKNLTLEELASAVHLHQLPGAFRSYCEELSPDLKTELNKFLPSITFDRWDTLCMQVRCIDDQTLLIPPETIRAIPPTIVEGKITRLGLGDTVAVRQSEARKYGCTEYPIMGMFHSRSSRSHQAHANFQNAT